MNILLNSIIALYFVSYLIMGIQSIIIGRKRVFDMTGRRINMKDINYHIKISPNEEIRKEVILLKKLLILNRILLVASILSIAINIIIYTQK